MTFFKSFLASCLGIFTTFILLMLGLFIFIGISSSNPLPEVKDNSILTIEMSQSLPARALPNPLESYFDPNAAHRLSLESLKSNLKKAAADDRIQGIWIKTNLLQTSWANLQQAYKYIEDYKKSGKFLYVSTDDLGMNEQSYYLATLADSIYSPPNTNFEFDGFVAQMTFYADLLNKIGIEPEIFRVGKYKSAVEPYLATSASAESKEQMREILEAATQTFIEAVTKKTGKSDTEIVDMLNSAPVNRLQFAADNGLIDVLAFENELESHIKTKVGVKDDEELNTISFKKYAQIPESAAGLPLPATFDKIAVIYAEGLIIPALGNETPLDNSPVITHDKLQKDLEEAINKSSVKAIVIYINSSGGAATTSDLIWNTIKTASEKKPIVASMGPVAASGGYYIAMGADTVVANPNTITGSIGIFNLLFNVQELTEDKIGLDFDAVKTHEYADLLDLTTPFTPSEKRIIQQNVEHGYEVFLSRVAEGRNMSRDEVHELAQGRVWTGSSAYKVGLVDTLGSLDDAIRIAADMADMEDYQIENYPKQKGLFEMLSAGAEAKVYAYLNSWVPIPKQEELNTLKKLINQPAGQNWMVMPSEITIQ